MVFLDALTKYVGNWRFSHTTRPLVKYQIDLVTPLANDTRDSLEVHSRSPPKEVSDAPHGDPFHAILKMENASHLMIGAQIYWWVNDMADKH